MTAPKPRRRWPWILAAVVIAAPLAGFLALRAFVNPEALRPRLVAAVEEATGRRFTVGGIGLALSLRPALELTDIALANAPGGSRPEMLTARRVAVQLALLPLLSRRVELSRVVLDQPDLLLETIEGRGNWQFHQAAGPPQPAPPAEPGGPSRARMQVALDTLRLEVGRITWRDAGMAETVEIVALDAAAPLAGPATARGTLRLRGAEGTIAAATGRVAGLGGAEPWPFDVTLDLPGGTRAALRGSLTPGGSWTLQAEAQSANPAALAPLLPDVPIPPLRDVVLSGRLAGTGAALTGAEALTLHAGESDLSVLRPGLLLARLELAAPRLDAPITLAAEASIAGLPLRATGTTGTLAVLAGRAPGPLPLDLRLAAGGAEATIRGQVRDPRAIAGVDLALAAQVPDLAALSPLAGAPLPALRDLRTAARLAERGAGFLGGAFLRGVTITAAPVEARGELTYVIGERHGLAGRLDVARLDLDALLAARPARPPAEATPGPAPARDGRVIPDLPLPIGALRTFDAELDLTVAVLTAGGAAWRDIRAPIRVTAGRARIAPLAVTTPGGPLTIEIAADAAAATPTLRVALRAPALDLAPLQRAFGEPVRISGHGEVDADLRGAGPGLRQVAASLGGHLGLAMLDATLEPPLTVPAQAALRSRVPILPDLPQRLPVECVALRAEAEGGVLRFGTLLIDAPAAKIAGSGTVNLGTEALALRLLHDIRAAGTSLRVAADLGGTLAEPSYRGVRSQNLGEVLGGLAGRVGGDAGALLGALANRNGARPEALPDCAPALTAARGGREGPMPTPRATRTPEAAPVPQPEAPPVPAVPGPAGDLLRGLLRP